MFANFANDPGHHLVRIHWEFAFNPQGKNLILLHRCHVFCICVPKAGTCVCRLSVQALKLPTWTNEQTEQHESKCHALLEATDPFSMRPEKICKKKDSCESRWSPHEKSRFRPRCLQRWRMPEPYPITTSTLRRDDAGDQGYKSNLVTGTSFEVIKSRGRFGIYFYHIFTTSENNCDNYFWLLAIVDYHLAIGCWLSLTGGLYDPIPSK